MTVIVGIDPGATGAYAVIEDGGQWVFDLPTMQTARRTVIDGAALIDHVQFLDPDVIAIEDNQIGPALGKAAVFSMGYSMGACMTAAMTSTARIVRFTPRQWQTHVGLTSVAGSRKEVHRQRAIEMFPACADDLARKKDHNRADALLIAEAARRHLNL
jgi:crossover junction endodeoxyribonuclease RuvC